MDANPNIQKRPRMDASGSGSDVAHSLFGKGVIEQVSRYAIPLIGEVKETLFKRAISLRKGVKSSRTRAASLEAATQEGKIVRSLEFRLSEDQRRLFPKVPEDLRESLRRLSQAMQVEAFRERQVEADLRKMEFQSIVEGSAFTLEAQRKLDVDFFGDKHPDAKSAMEALIRDEQESFRLEMAIKFKQLDAADARRETRSALNRQRSEQVRMQVEQQDTATTVKRFVAEAIRKATPALIKEIKAAVKESSSKRVHFKPPGNGGQSRGRSKPRSAPHSRPRGRSPGRRPFSKGRSSSRGGSTTPKRKTTHGDKAKGRSGSRPVRDGDRSSSRGNANGGRGTPSRKPPRDKQGGNARVGGGGGSKTGSRR